MALYSRLQVLPEFILVPNWYLEDNLEDYHGPIILTQHSTDADRGRLYTPT